MLVANAFWEDGHKPFAVRQSGVRKTQTRSQGVCNSMEAECRRDPSMRGRIHKESSARPCNCIRIHLCSLHWPDTGVEAGSWLSAVSFCVAQSSVSRPGALEPYRLPRFARIALHACMQAQKVICAYQLKAAVGMTGEGSDPTPFAFWSSTPRTPPHFCRMQMQRGWLVLECSDGKVRNRT